MSDKSPKGTAKNEGLIGFHRQRPARLYRPMEAAGNVARYWMHPKSWLLLTLFLLLAAIYVAQSAPYWVAVIDDSYITFRFVDMFVQGYGWRFSPTGPRVEGFTNFLWASSLLIPHALHWDLMFTAKIMGLVCGVLTMAASWGFARAVRNRDDIFNLLPAAILATNASFGHWALMGLETLMQTALVTAAYWRFEVERRDERTWQLSPLICVLAAMTRIDSLYYLAPLGAYGMWLILFRQLRFRRMLTWALLAAIPFAVYWGWKWTYFGDVLPNTYYAKQRLVQFEGHDRGKLQLEIFYFDMANFPGRIPADPSKMTNMGNKAWAFNLDRKLWDFALASHNSLIWMNLWLTSALLCVLAMMLPILFAKQRRRSRFFGDVHTGKIFFLIFLPWGMNVFYLYHVNGDWMPSFRFFQVIIPFIGVAAAVGFGYLRQIVWELTKSKKLTIATSAAAGVTAGYLLLGTAVEQLHLHSVSIYSKDGIYWGQRQQLWWLPDNIKAAYRKGFSPPLESVSDWLLLNTQDNGWIFMSDIGQPLWFASHLNLYDVDGLTDPFLAHAPSARGRLKSTRESFEEKLEQRVNSRVDELKRTRKLGEIDEAAMKNLRKEARKDVLVKKEDIEKEAKRAEFEAYQKRNANMIMEQRCPEYLLIFLNHSTNDPKSNGWPYPEISSRVYRHPNIKNYIEDAALPKIGNVYNHIFRRSDVPKEVPNSVKIERLLKTIERNPRMPYLIGLLYRQSLDMKDLSQEQRDKIDAIVLSAMDRWQGDPILGELARLARRSGKGQIAETFLLKAIDADPDNTANYWSLSGLYEQNKEYAKAAALMEKADRNSASTSNGILYHLIYLYETAGDLESAKRVGEMAIERNPKDSRAWSDYASMLDRASQKMDRPVKERLELKKRAKGLFEEYLKLVGTKPLAVGATMDRLDKGIAELEAELAPPEPKPLRRTELPEKPRFIPEVTALPLNETNYNARPETTYQAEAETQYE